MEKKPDVSLSDLRGGSSRRIIAVGDIHGCFNPLLRILGHAGLIDDRLGWVGDSSSLVLLGDLEDEGAESYQVINLARSLQSEAPDNVKVILGNHDVMLLSGMSGDSAYLNFETAWSFAKHHVELHAALTSTGVRKLQTDDVAGMFQHTFLTDGLISLDMEYIGKTESVPASELEHLTELLHNALDQDGLGEWIRTLPAAVTIDEWIFFHGGPPLEYDGDMAQLNADIRRLIADGDWNHPLLAAGHNQHSPIWTRNWFNNGQEWVDQHLHKYGAKRIAFGHSPGAINGTFGQLCQLWNTVFKADSYIPLGVEGYLEILDSTVWAVYTDAGIEVLARLYPDSTLAPAVLLAELD